MIRLQITKVKMTRDVDNYNTVRFHTRKKKFQQHGLTKARHSQNIKGITKYEITDHY